MTALERIEDALAKMTGGAGGKWALSGFHFSPIKSADGDYIIEAVDGHVYSDYASDPATVEIAQGDLAGIVTLRNDAPALVAEVKRLREALRTIETGSIKNEPNNHRDTLAVIRGIARDALTKDAA